ncbi:NHS-like protein 3 isoform X2 [Eleginops maclovinus]|uniref:NHS-like protein 3 isoform X2 n=1 Tax=Eleginops maclovinus TaxID=56733 RepID=UPI003080A315
MGNSVHKKKKLHSNFSVPVSPSPKREKTKGFGLFGHQDKVKTAGPKGNEEQKRLTVHYSTSQHYQENVFIEGSRPQYLEDLHTEAQEGLKIQQQEEHTNGLNLPDNESIASTDTLRPEQDVSSKDDDCGSPESRSTTGSSDTTVTSAVSTRPVLTRQGSTFKPLNPVKTIDRSRKRGRRTTIMGIPNQVQKELALHRSFQQLDSTPNHDGKLSTSQSGVVTVDGGTPEAKKEGARVHLSELEASRDEQLLRKQLQAMYQDEQPFKHQGLGSYLCPNSSMRPKSLAVPGMTTSSSFCPTTMLSFLQEPQGPVMSMSPQATYLSTIIPNAILPSSIDVIEIDRSCSRTRGASVNHGSSVRTVSKSSLASGDLSVSPFLSRRSDGDGSQTDNSQSESTLMLTSASGLNWSETQSSKIIISNSSPGSSKGSTRSGNSLRVGPNGRESQAEQCNGDQDIDSLRSSVSMISSFSSKRECVTGQESESDVSGSVAAGDDAKTKQNCTRSLSVMKTKQPPPPPRRTNSLHSNKIRSNSKVLVEINDSASGDGANVTENSIDGKKSVKLQTSTGSSCLEASSGPLTPTQASSTGGATEPEHSNYSPQKAPSEGGKFERTMSPSSGYSSQSGTPTLTPKGISPTSPDKHKKKPVKPERSVSRVSSSAASPSSSLTSLSSGTSEPVNPDSSTCSSSLPSQGSQPIVAADELAPNNISSTFAAEVRELLKIPPPPKVKAPCPPPPEAWVHNKRTFQLLFGPYPNVGKVTQDPAQKQDSTVKQAGTQTEDIKEIPVLVEKQSKVAQSVLETHVNPETLLESSPEGVYKIENRECPSNKQEEIQVSSDVQKQEENLVVKDPKSPKKEPPPVMKKPVTVLHREELVKKESATSAVHLPVENHPTATQHGVIIVVDKSDNERAKSDVAFVEVPKMTKVSPPPSPPPAYHPTPPLSRKTPPSSVSSPPDDLQGLQEEINVVESCWPPPPPPMEGDSVFDGGDDVDFPPPPPPLVTESVLNVMDSCVTDLVASTTPTEVVRETSDDSSEANTPVREQIADAPPAAPQTVTDIEPEVVVQDSESHIADDIICRPVQSLVSVSDCVPSPPVVATPLATITKADPPILESTLVPPSSSLKRDSLKMEDQSPNVAPVSAQPPVTAPVAPPLPAEGLTQGVNFRRQPSVQNRDARSKELLSRHKSSAPIPKEDANIPLVTPSLLQMVRLRSVNMTEDVMKAEGEDKTTNQGASVQDDYSVSVTGAQNIPQKPIRKSLSLKSPPQSVKTSSVTLIAPSMRLQEAIRMKTAAMSSRDGLPSRLGVRSPYSSLGERGALSLKSHEGSDMLKSPASTASFIFSRSTKKVVIETPAAFSPEAQVSLKQSLAAELMQVSDQSKAAVYSNGGVKSDRAPPPVAKKPASGSISPSHNQPAGSAKMDFSVEGNGVIGAVQHTSGITHPEITTTRVTADTIETLF